MWRSSLPSDRWYFYRFLLGNAVSGTGRTRTLPAPDAVVARLRLAYASCQQCPGKRIFRTTLPAIG